MSGYFFGAWLRETFGPGVIVPLMFLVLLSGMWAFASWARSRR
jgi:hypothetical protein